MKLYPINFDCAKDTVTSTRDVDVQKTIPLAKAWIKVNVVKGITKDDLVKLIEKQFPIFTTSEVINLVIDPLIGVDLKYNDTIIKLTEVKEIVK